jgi:hypothetical protein
LKPGIKCYKCTQQVWALPGRVPILPIQHDSGPQKQRWARYGCAEVR